MSGAIAAADAPGLGAEGEIRVAGFARGPAALVGRKVEKGEGCRRETGGHAREAAFTGGSRC